MSDIHNCKICNDKVYMDNAECCIVCGEWFCGDCDYENGIKIWSENNSTYYYVCKYCLEEGLDYINLDNMDDTEFDEGEYDSAIKELNLRAKRR